MAEDEFAYTKRKIDENLSNFSAWHNRSQLILRVLEERGASDEARRKLLDEELERIREALNVGPEDQSLWYYHRFLMSQIADHQDSTSIAPALTLQERSDHLRREIDEIKDLLEDYRDVKWIYEALLEYSLALGRLEQGKAHDAEGDARTWLEKVRSLDPMRRGRWEDIEGQLLSQGVTA